MARWQHFIIGFILYMVPTLNGDFVSDQKYSPIQLNGGATYLPESCRKSALLLPCRNYSSSDCLLSKKFEANDPLGTKFLEQHMAAVSFIRSDSSYLGSYRSFTELFEEWILYFKKRNVTFLLVLCDKTKASETCCQRKKEKQSYIYMDGNRYEENLEIPCDDASTLFIQLLNLLYGQPVFPAPTVDKENPASIKGKWKSLLQPFLETQETNFMNSRFLLITMIKNTVSQKYQILLELGALLRPHGGIVASTADVATTGLQMSTKLKKGYFLYDLRQKSDCSIDDIPGTCRYLRTFKYTTILSSFPEEIVCDILLTKSNGSVERKITIDKSPSDSDIVTNILKVCPLILVIQKRETPSLTKATIDRLIEKYYKQYLVVIEVSGSKTEYMKTINMHSNSKNAQSSAMLLTRHHLATAESFTIQHNSKEHFTHDLEDKLSVYQYRRSQNPELTYLRFDPPSLFAMENEELFHKIKNYKARNRITSDSFADDDISDMEFEKIKEKSVFLVNFYQSWALRSMVSQILVREVNTILKKKYGIKERHIASIHCFDYNELCEKEGVTTYPTMKIYRNGTGMKIKETLSVNNLLRLIILSSENRVKNVSSLEEFNKVTKKFSPLVHSIFVGVDLSPKQLNCFTTAAKKYHGKELFITTKTSALPKHLKEQIKTSSIFSFHPKFKNSIKVMEKVGSKDFHNFILSSKISELTWEDYKSMDLEKQSLLILLSRQLTHSNMDSLTTIATKYHGKILTRWLDANKPLAHSVMKVYGIYQTPTIIIKTKDKIYKYQGKTFDANAVISWIEDVLKGKLSIDFKLPTTSFKPFPQGTDFSFAFYDKKTNMNPEIQNGDPSEMEEMEETEMVDEFEDPEHPPHEEL